MQPIPIRFSMIDDPDEALQIIKKDVGRIRHLMDSAKREDVLLEAVKKAGYALQYIRGKFQTENIAFTAMNNEGDAFIFVDEINKTPRVCLAAVRKTGDAIRYMRPNEQTDEVCIAAIQQYSEVGGCIDAFRFIHRSRHSEIICIEAAKKDYKFITHIDDDNLTDNVIKAFIDSNYKSLELMQNKDLLNDDICLYAVKRHGGSIAVIPHKFHTDEIIDLAISSNGYSAQYLIPEKITTERAWICIKNKPDAIRYIPVEVRTFQMYVEAASRLAQTLQYVHRKDWFFQIATLLKINICN